VLLAKSGRHYDQHITDCGAPPYALWRRLLLRAGLSPETSVAVQRRVTNAKVQAESRNGPQNFELFSPPFSRARPELHPWCNDGAVLHLNWVAGMLDWRRFFCTNQTAPVVITLHDQHHYLGGLHYSGDLLRNPWLRAEEQRMSGIKKKALTGRRCVIVGNSEWNTSEAKRSGMFSSDCEYTTIPYSLDEHLYSSDARNGAKEKIEIESKCFTVGFASDDVTNHRKGFDILLRAVEQLSPALREQMHLVSFGREPESTVRSTCTIPWSHLGFLKTDEQRANAYRAMDLFIVPSREEAFGQTAIEAITSGCRVIASEVGGLAEALVNGEAGQLIAPESPASLSRAIEHEACSPSGKHLLAKARDIVTTKHSPERHARAYQDVFQQARALVR